MDLVVARYKENIEWLPPEWLRYTHLYNKGPPLTDTTKFARYKELPNVGRESHTYLRYIVDNYERLPELIVFTQADPFYHCPDFINRVREALKNPPKTLTGLGIMCSIVDMTCEHNPQVDNIIKKVYNSVVGGKHPKHFIFHAGAILIVPKKFILSRTKSHYSSAMRWLNYSTNPLEGHCFERLWRPIFTYKINPPTNRNKILPKKKK